MFKGSKIRQPIWEFLSKYRADCVECLRQLLWPKFQIHSFFTNALYKILILLHGVLVQPLKFFWFVCCHISQSGHASLLEDQGYLFERILRFMLYYILISDTVTMRFSRCMTIELGIHLTRKLSYSFFLRISILIWILKYTNHLLPYWMCNTSKLLRNRSSEILVHTTNSRFAVCCCFRFSDFLSTARVSRIALTACTPFGLATMKSDSSEAVQRNIVQNSTRTADLAFNFWQNLSHTSSFPFVFI